MYHPESRHYKGTAGKDQRVLDTIVDCGPLAGRMLAAQDRHQHGAEMAAVWRATYADQAPATASARQPGTWRRTLGGLLVRAGTRLGGATVRPTAPELAQVVN